MWRELDERYGGVKGLSERKVERERERCGMYVSVSSSRVLTVQVFRNGSSNVTEIKAVDLVPGDIVEVAGELCMPLDGSVC